LVELISIKPIHKGSLKGFAAVSIARKIVIHSCRIIQQDGQQAWVSMPQQEVPSTSGKAKYYPIVEIKDEALKQQITDVILASYVPQPVEDQQAFRDRF
jgi:DNA-binding cell septation regulator SpoVG